MSGYTCRYSGCSSIDDQIDEISSNIEPYVFYDKYIATRTPVKFRDILNDESWKIPGSLDTFEKMFVEGMKAQGSGNVSDIIKVEERASAEDRFGEGSELRMKFVDFLGEMKRNNNLLYMTTQAITATEGLEGADETVRPAIVSPPLTALVDAFPIRPKLMGNLIPANLNLWLGCHSGGSGFSSSGLHHDYHDNLYVLLKGTKEFTLISPGHHEALYPVGEVARVHPNGRFNYEGELTESDGSHSSSLKAFLANQKLAAAAAADADYDQDDDEDAVDAALQDVLDAECAGEYDDSYGDSDGGSSEEEDGSGVFGLPSTLSAAALKSVVAKPDGAAARKRKGEAGLVTDTADDKRLRAEDPAEAQTVRENYPPNFSRLGTNVADLARQYMRGEGGNEFPLFKKLVSSSSSKLAADVIPNVSVVTLSAGEMLYLPAGWYHEVRSSGSTATQQTDESGKDVHMAFNYWFHPPDNCANEKRETVTGFTHPYSSDFWMLDWQQRVKEKL